jgi:DNA-binding response OmpR family regulator
MENMDFGKVALVLGDPSRMIRQGLKGALFTQGFREILDSDKVSVIREAVAENNVDLLICDATLPDGDVCQLTRDIRHHRIGNNPFIVIITLIDEPDRDLVMKVINSGSDDVVLKPFSPAKLIERVKHLSRNRKRFVVTTDYIGPNRRDGEETREGEVIPEIDVPNPVRAKAQRMADTDALQRAVDAVARVINEQQMGRHAIQIDYLVNRIVPRYEKEDVDDSVIDDLDHLLIVSQDIGRRMKGTPHEHIGDLCQSMVSVTTSVRERPRDPDPKDIQLLPELARAIKRAFGPTDDTAALSRDISESVKRRGA